MSVTDPVADMLTIVRNGCMARMEAVEVKRSKLTENILNVLKREGFISNLKPIGDKKQGLLKVYLKYGKEKAPAISGLKKISKPGCRVYVKAKDIKSVYSGIGIAVISTAQGVVTDNEAKEKNIGGEVVCHAW